MNFEDLRHEKTGQGVASITEFFTDLKFSNSDLHVGLVHTGCKPLMNHFAIFSPSFSRTKYLSFDVRELLGIQSIQIPLKGIDRVVFIKEELEERFDDDTELLLAIISSKSVSMR